MDEQNRVNAGSTEQATSVARRAGKALDETPGAAYAGDGATLADGHVRGATFAKAAVRDAACGSLGLSGFVVVELEGVGPSVRGRLADVIDDAIERELCARGAAGPGITSASDRDAALSDQLFRARRAGAAGIAIILGPLRAAAGPQGALEPDDSATLRFLADATRERPLVLLLDDRDAKTGGYGDPVPLADLLGGALGAPLPASRDCPSAPPTCGTYVSAIAPFLEHDERDGAEGQATPDDDASAPAPTARPYAAHETRDARESTTTTEPAAPGVTSRRHTAGANVVEQEEAWRAWTLQLTAARGPQPLAALERIFAESYVPLSNALALGLDDARAKAAHDEFRSGFAKSYSEAFPTFGATTKRPLMVLDVHDVAGRIARLHGARSTRMLLVDGMRWDVSRLIEERVAARLGARAAMTDRHVLWSALPTTTMRQLETIARGIDALRTPGEIDADAEPPRGRTAEYVRRLRVGPREVHKLDLVESRLQGARGTVVRSLPEIAEATAEAVARHAETLAPKTLLFVFGDHGFTVDRTGAARQGGSSPEEVLVGAFAFLVGDTH